MGTEQKALEDKFTEEYRALMAIPEPQRSEYVKNVIVNMVEPFKQLKNLPKFRQGQMAEALLKELNSKATILLPCLMYTVKPEFVDFYAELMESIEK